MASILCEKACGSGITLSDRLFGDRFVRVLARSLASSRPQDKAGSIGNAPYPGAVVVPPQGMGPSLPRRVGHCSLWFDTVGVIRVAEVPRRTPECRASSTRGSSSGGWRCYSLDSASCRNALRTIRRFFNNGTHAAHGAKRSVPRGFLLGCL